MYKIEDKVAIPEITSTRVSKYPFDQMTAVGQSFLVEAENDSEKDPVGYTEEIRRIRNSLSGAANRYGRRFEPNVRPKFLIREVPEVGVRCWLVEKPKAK